MKYSITLHRYIDNKFQDCNVGSNTCFGEDLSKSMYIDKDVGAIFSTNFYPSLYLDFYKQKIEGDIPLLMRKNIIRKKFKREFNRQGIYIKEIHNHREYNHLHIIASLTKENLDYLAGRFFN